MFIWPYHAKRTHQMFKIYVLRAEDLPSADIGGKSDPYCVVEHRDKQGKTYRLGQTRTLNDNSNPTWDQNREYPFEFPFVKSDDSTITFHIFDHDQIGSDDLIGTCQISLNNVPLCKELSYPVVVPKSTKNNPSLWVYIDTCFSQTEQGNAAFKSHNYLYIYMQYPASSPGGNSAELQIYQCSKTDGGVSNLYTKQNSKPGLIERQVFKTCFAPDCDQMWLLHLDKVTPDMVFVPIIKVNTIPGDFTITYVFYGLNDLPHMDQDAGGVYEYNKLVFESVTNPKFKPIMIHQHVRHTTHFPDAFVDAYRFSVADNEIEFMSVPSIVQSKMSFHEFTGSLRKSILPRTTKIWNRVKMGTSMVYSLEDLSKPHDGRETPRKIKLDFQWSGTLDLDMSVCALNKNNDCVGRVSFHDSGWFNGALFHIEPCRIATGEEQGGLEEVVIDFDNIPNQVKALLVVITSYGGQPLANLKSALRILDDKDQYELLYYDLCPTEQKTAVMLGMFTRSKLTWWDFFPTLHYLDATKPYNAHAMLKRFFKDQNYVAQQYQRFNRQRT